MRAVKSHRGSAMIVGRFSHGLRPRGQIRRRIVHFLPTGQSHLPICGIAQQDWATRWPLAARWNGLESWGEVAS